MSWKYRAFFSSEFCSLHYNHIVVKILDFIFISKKSHFQKSQLDKTVTQTIHGTLNANTKLGKMSCTSWYLWLKDTNTASKFLGDEMGVISVRGQKIDCFNMSIYFQQQVAFLPRGDVSLTLPPILWHGKCICPFLIFIKKAFMFQAAVMKNRERIKGKSGLQCPFLLFSSESKHGVTMCNTTICLANKYCPLLETVPHTIVAFCKFLACVLACWVH